MSVPADQWWFWAPEWQAVERGADQDPAVGRSVDFATGEDLFAHLAEISEPGPAA